MNFYENQLICAKKKKFHENPISTHSLSRFSFYNSCLAHNNAAEQLRKWNLNLSKNPKISFTHKLFFSSAFRLMEMKHSCRSPRLFARRNYIFPLELALFFPMIKIREELTADLSCVQNEATPYFFHHTRSCVDRFEMKANCLAKLTASNSQCACQQCMCGTLQFLDDSSTRPLASTHARLLLLRWL